MNERAEWKSSELACSDALKQLLTRHSVGPKHLVPPAPTEEQVWLAVWSALRAPDHQKLLPFRFVLIPDEMRPLLVSFSPTLRAEAASLTKKLS